ncbi:ABC transporter substrate-binding protein [Sphaerisporangium flaviroseum]|uniref:ABC transporter substrate-binding protein n=1 Tax=Sphaerisporangium flaviroseum TaxID=509199 RepID=A0ABP7I4G1_9ACTN
MSRNRRWAPSLALASLALVGACATPTDAPAAKPSKEGPAALAKDTQAATLLPEDVKKAGVIRVGAEVGYAPMSFFDADGKTIIGAEPDLMAAVGQALGVKVEWTNTAWDGIFPALNSGRFDVVVNAVTDTKEREAQNDFVQYFSAGSALLVKKGNPKKIQGLADLCGKTVALQTGTQQVDIVKGQQAKCGASKIKVLVYPADSGAVLQVRNGRADAGMQDFPAAAWNAQRAGGGKLFEVLTSEQYKPGSYGIVIAKNRTQLRDAIQAGLKKAIESGAYAKILEKWNISAGSLTTAQINGAQE